MRPNLQYLLAVQTPATPISADRFAIESAFAEHLRELKTALVAAGFERIILVAPTRENTGHHTAGVALAELDANTDGIELFPAYPVGISLSSLWLRHLPTLRQRLREKLESVGFVHSGLATSVGYPLLLVVNQLALKARIPLLFIVDIDYREHGRQSLRIGRWSKGKYLAGKVSVDLFKLVQLNQVIKAGELVLLKSSSMAADFGRGRPNVRAFLDTVHSAAQILSKDEARLRLSELSVSGTLRVCYFGRLAWNKGVDHMIEAVHLARRKGVDVVLSIIGDGPCRDDLARKIEELALQDVVWLQSAVAYGEALFQEIGRAHLMIAAPLIEDTPRAAFDAMARGLPILAYDISYFRDLAGESDAVDLAIWPEPSSLAQRLQVLTDDRTRLAKLAHNGLSFAAKNTQQFWINLRLSWTLEHARKHSSRPVAPDRSSI